MLKPMKIYFNEELHRYQDENGVIHPSVSIIIRTADHFKNIPIEKQKEVMDRGTRLHQNIDLFVNTGETMGDKVLESFAAIYGDLCRRYGKYIGGEMPLGASYDSMPFCGKPDIVLENAVVDIKSSLSAERVYAMQLEAYALLLEANDVTKPEFRILCYRNRDNWAYKVVQQEYGTVAVRDAFVAALKRHYAEKLLHIYHNSL